ncbi:MAG: ATP-binding protein [Tannerellaceae bacterium]
MEEQKVEIEKLQMQIRNLEKLSSLGMLSAGIAHEIQNPLNFVINFSKLSDKLVDDLKEIIEEEKEILSPELWEKLSDIREELNETLSDLHTNLQKIEEHGNRATSIIRGILLYSRGKEDEFMPTNIQQLVKEYVWLSYHSMRANYKGFNISLREHYEENLPLIPLIPQDFSRAVLNIMNNACYAVYSKAKTALADYQPIITIDLHQEDGNIRLTIEDNGTGMTDEVRAKIFTAFFTTKPIGEGTGLGLSITQSIIEDKHHGKIELDSRMGEYTRFSFLIPFNQK